MNEQWPLFGHGVGLYWEQPYIGGKMYHPDDTFDSNIVLGVEAFLAAVLYEDRAEIIVQSLMRWW